MKFPLKNEMMEIQLTEMAEKVIVQLLKLTGFVQEVLQPLLIFEHNALQDFIRIIQLILKIESLNEEMGLKWA